MKKTSLILLIVALSTLSVLGQEAGNRNYNQRERRAAPNTGMIFSNGEQYIETFVLMNAQPDEFVAVFGVAQEGSSAAESNQKVNTLIDKFLSAAEKLGVSRSNTFVDFITQNRVYNFSPPSEGVIRETLSGFETKKTVAVRYKDRPLLEKLLAAAAQASIFDLIKVDYVINDMTKIRARLFEEATRVVKQKEENYIHTLGLAIRRLGLAQETYDTYYPGELYRTYQAFESGVVDPYYGSNNGTRVIRERKSTTSYLEPLDKSDFDAVVNSIGIEPVVQCTLYMKVLYSVAK
ncbi:MAG: SIMPL domain-containing protein [Acidobacteriota bacterium]|nr:SIMPL domain-containing protein [Acidobacteriota bacterium]